MAITLVTVILIMGIVVGATVWYARQCLRERIEGYRARWRAMDPSERQAWITVLRQRPWMATVDHTWEQFVWERFVETKSERR